MIELPTQDIHLDHARPLQAQLYVYLTQRIMLRRLLPGSLLPSSRQLASELAISRNTVNAVYEQMKAEGFIYAEAGRGVFVHTDIPVEIKTDRQKREISQPVETVQTLPNNSKSSPAITAAMAPCPNQQSNQHQYRYLNESLQDNSLPLTPGLPDLTAFPIRAWNRILHHQESRKVLMGYDQHQGYLPLRRMVSAYLRAHRGVRCSEQQVIITHGAQQALALIAEVCLNRGDKVLFEDPGYRGARYALNRLGNELTPVKLQNQALNIVDLPADPDARLLYCTPTHQYPMGGILTISERISLLEWAAKNHLWIIEDDYDSEFHFNGKPIAAIQGLYPQTPVLYLGSFSKTLFPALRVGYLVVPETLIEPFVWAKRITGGESALLNQAVIAEFIETGQFSKHLRRMRQLYKEKWQLFHYLTTTQLGDHLVPVAESAGMHLVLLGNIDDRQVTYKLYQHGFGSTALSNHFIGKELKHGLISGFANASENQMKNYVELLAKLLKDQ